ACVQPLPDESGCQDRDLRGWRSAAIGTPPRLSRPPQCQPFEAPGREAKLLFRFGVRSAAQAGRIVNEVGSELFECFGLGQAWRLWRSDGIGKRGEPDRNFAWVIVHDVVDAWFAFERGSRSRRGVCD